MKKIFTISSISLCALSIISTTCLSLIPGVVGAMFLYGGITFGVLGVGLGATAGILEKKQIENNSKSFETSCYNRKQMLTGTDRIFEKHATQSKTNMQKINSNNDLTK